MWSWSAKTARGLRSSPNTLTDGLYSCNSSCRELHVDGWSVGDRNTLRVSDGPICRDVRVDWQCSNYRGWSPGLRSWLCAATQWLQRLQLHDRRGEGKVGRVMFDLRKAACSSSYTHMKIFLLAKINDYQEQVEIAKRTKMHDLAWSGEYIFVDVDASTFADVHLSGTVFLVVNLNPGIELLMNF